MYFVVGLGNPGEKYLLSRHNAGRIVLVDALANYDFPIAELQNGRLGKVVTGRVGENPVSVLFPETFMNDSGRSVMKFVRSDNLNKLIVVYDDVDLPLGEFKVSFNRGAGGHNGVSSIISHLHSPEFIRIRVGVAKKNLFGKTIRPDKAKLADFVINNFSTKELAKLNEVSKSVGECLEVIISDGVERAMNKFN